MYLDRRLDPATFVTVYNNSNKKQSLGGYINPPSLYMS